MFTAEADAAGDTEKSDGERPTENAVWSGKWMAVGSTRNGRSPVVNPKYWEGVGVSVVPQRAPVDDCVFRRTQHCSLDVLKQIASGESLPSKKHSDIEFPLEIPLGFLFMFSFV